MKFAHSMLLLLLAGASPVGQTIPPLHASTLTSQWVSFPADCAGKSTVLIMGFTEDSRTQVAAWGRRLALDYNQSPTVSYYEMADLAAVPRLLRGLVLGKIRESVPDRAKPHFLPFTDHEADWKSAADYRGSAKEADKNDAFLVVADASGTIRYRTHGALDEAVYAALKQQLQVSTSPASPAHP